MPIFCQILGLFCLLNGSTLEASLKGTDPMQVSNGLDGIVAKTVDISRPTRTKDLAFSGLRPRLICGFFVGSSCPTAWWHTDDYKNLAKTFPDVMFVFVHSNRSEETSDVASKMRLSKLDMPNMFLVDDRQSQLLKRRLGATLTPTAFVIDKDGKLRYFGVIGGTAPENKYTFLALEQVEKGEEVRTKRTSVFGCSIN